MSQPIYFLPGVSAAAVRNPHTEKLDRTILKAHGLDGIFSDVGFDDSGCQDIHAGPDDKSGALLYYQTPDGKLPQLLGYYPDKQTWTQCGTFWIGYETDNPPKEPDLRRRRQCLGYKLIDDLGQQWEIPIVRRPDDSTELPCSMHYDAGKIVEPVKEAYRKHWELTAEVVLWFFNDSGTFGGETFSKARAFALAIETLGINYRFGQAEQRLADVPDSLNIGTVLGFSVDYPRYAAISRAEKKSESRLTTPNTTTGATVDCQATGPVEQISG